MKWIFHKHEALVVYSLNTDLQPVMYWAIDHLLARLYFNSNTQETTIRQEYLSDVTGFTPFHEKKSCQKL